MAFVEDLFEHSEFPRDWSIGYEGREQPQLKIFFGGTDNKFPYGSLHEWRILISGNIIDKFGHVKAKTQANSIIKWFKDQSHIFKDELKRNDLFFGAGKLLGEQIAWSLHLKTIASFPNEKSESYKAHKRIKEAIQIMKDSSDQVLMANIENAKQLARSLGEPTGLHISEAYKMITYEYLGDGRGGQKHSNVDNDITVFLRELIEQSYSNYTVELDKHGTIADERVYLNKQYELQNHSLGARKLGELSNLFGFELKKDLRKQQLKQGKVNLK